MIFRLILRNIFETIAKETFNPNGDKKYDSNVQQEYSVIRNIVKHKDIKPVTLIELKKVLQQLNTGSSPEFYDLTVENFL